MATIELLGKAAKVTIDLAKLFQDLAALQADVERLKNQVALLNQKAWMSH